MFLILDIAIAFFMKWNETVHKLACFLLIYGTVSLILTILVNEQILYVPIDAVVSFWSVVFFVFNPFPVLYRSILVLLRGPSVWISSTTLMVILFVYPIIMIAIGLILLARAMLCKPLSERRPHE